MANRDMTNQMFSFEKARKAVNAHVYFASDGSVTLDGAGSKGVLSAAQVTTPSQNGTYTINFGVSVNSISYRDAYKKLLSVMSTPEIEFTGAASPTASAHPAIWKDDCANNVPIFGDVAPVQSALADGGTSGTYANNAYKFLVTAYDVNGNETSLATAIAQEKTITPTALHKVTIAWTALTQDGVAGYCIYRTTAAGASGTENILVAIVPGATSNTYTDAGDAPTTVYRPGTSGAHVANSKITAATPVNALPPYTYCGVTLAFYVATTLTNPGAGEGARIQFEFGDSDAA